MVGSMSFDDIIKNAYIDTYFQPIVDLSNGNIIGYEALSRGPRGTDYYYPNALISEAKSRNRIHELDYLLRKMTLVNASKRGIRKLLFINIDPICLYDVDGTENVVRNSGEFGIPPRRIVVEVSERSAVCSFEKFQNTIESYRKDGFLIACDDINCGFSNINAMSTINPNFIKIDDKFVHGIDQNTDIDKITQLNSVITIAKMIKAKVIAVGVETPQELKYLYHMGVDAAQGNLLGAPQKEIRGISEETERLIKDINAVQVDTTA